MRQEVESELGLSRRQEPADAVPAEPAAAPATPPEEERAAPTAQPVSPPEEDWFAPAGAEQPAEEDWFRAPAAEGAAAPEDDWFAPAGDQTAPRSGGAGLDLDALFDDLFAAAERPAAETPPTDWDISAGTVPEEVPEPEPEVDEEADAELEALPLVYEVTLDQLMEMAG